MLKKTLIAAVSAIALVLPAVTASAQPPEETVVEDFIVLYPDLEYNLSVFINITARDFCDWVPDGPEPPTGPPPAIDTVTSIGIETGKGAIVTKLDADDLYIEMWDLGEDSPLIGPCEDIQDQLDDPDAEPWASGTASFKAKDNDFFGTGTRGNAFGDRITAVITDQDGNNYDYTSLFRINSKCHAPEFEAPSCLVEKSRLRMV